MQLRAGEIIGGQNLTAKQLKDLLVVLGKDRCKKSFRALFEHFAPRLKSFFLKIGTNEEVAEELIQETFVQVWRKAHTYNPEKAAASTWIFTIARNRRIDRFRSEKSFIYKDEQFFSTVLVTEESQSQTVFESELGHRVRDALALLPANQSEIIHLSFFKDLSHSEIAQHLSLPLGTVKSRIRLAFKQLRTILAGLET
ncbi:RNA polymerase subunit sigma-70 [Cohaesibacter celericrescens]|uniref:RNA polymerase sigma factor n=2 Tax=Cohaesibacter celericrescens TaxID=2067669 RepID=A0A2N5XPU1_9HYPH|nr:RNA polymerase subunit sigma-70 [Cohaesibacter celericrescens]